MSDAQAVRRPRPSSWRCWSRRPFVMFRGEEREDAHRALPAHGLASTRAPTCGSSASRSARSRRSTPAGTDVKVKMSYDAKYKVPADAKAVIISPAIVGDRFVQLTPVYEEGDVLADGADARARTAPPSPLELDQIYQSLDDLTVALGPNGANKQGALTRAARDHRAATSAARASSSTRPSRTSASSPAPSTTTRRSCSAPPRQLERLHQHPRRERPDRPPASTTRWPTCSGAARRTSARSSRRRCSNLGVAMSEVSDVRARRTATIARPQHQGPQPGRRRSWSSSAARSTRSSRSRRWRWTTSTTTYNPQAGTLDTRANLGENVDQHRRRPGGVPVQRSSARSTRPARICDADRAAPACRGACREPPPSAEARARLGRTGSTRRSADSWRCAMNAARRARASCARWSRRRLRADRLRLRRLQLPLPGGADARRQPDHGHGRVPRRPRPGAASRRSRSTTSPSARSTTSSSTGYTAEVTARAARATSSCPTTPIAEIRQTSLLGEKFVSLSPPEDGASDGPLDERRRHPARPHRPQPRGRGGPRRAVAAAQRRRRRPAEDDRAPS